MRPEDAAASSIDKRLERLIKMGEPRRYERNEILISEGDPSDSVLLLVSGQLKAFTRDPSGRELVYAIIEPGEIFGELFLDSTRSASVKAVSPSQCVVLEESKVHALIRKQPDFAECLIRILSARLRNATYTIRDLVLSDVFGRTTALLSNVARSEGKLRVVPITLTQQEIADRVGATREMINHVIAELIKGGHLVRDERRRLVFSKDLPRTSKPRSN